MTRLKWNLKCSQVMAYKKHIYRIYMIQYLKSEICTKYDFKHLKLNKNKDIYMPAQYMKDYKNIKEVDVKY